MLRLIGFLAMLSVGAVGILAVDYTIQRQQVLEEEDVELTVAEYIDELPARIAVATSSSRSAGLPSDLTEMLPQPPSGWTVRPTVPEDDAIFLPAARGDGDAQAIRLIRETTRLNVRRAEEVVALTYERGDRMVVFMLARYADGIFTDPAAFQLRHDLQTAGATFRSLDSMTVRGLDVTEDFLPDGMRGRLFIANVSGQIHLRILAPRRMSESDLLPFLETLNVKALNASVIDRVDGLGEIPVIALAADMPDEGREAYQAERAARRADILARADAARDEAAAEIAAKAGPAAVQPEAAGPVADCERGEGGIKRCKVSE